jgi:hypothetical protein
MVVVSLARIIRPVDVEPRAAARGCSRPHAGLRAFVAGGLCLASGLAAGCAGLFDERPARVFYQAVAADFSRSADWSRRCGEISYLADIALQRDDIDVVSLEALGVGNELRDNAPFTVVAPTSYDKRQRAPYKNPVEAEKQRREAWLRQIEDACVAAAKAFPRPADDPRNPLKESPIATAVGAASDSLVGNCQESEKRGSRCVETRVNILSDMLETGVADLHDRIYRAARPDSPKPDSPVKPLVAAGVAVNVCGISQVTGAGKKASAEQLVNGWRPYLGPAAPGVFVPVCKARPGAPRFDLETLEVTR